MIKSPYHIIFLFLFAFLVNSQECLAQLSKLKKVKKTEMTYQYPTTDGFIPCIDKKLKEHWIVYSDRERNEAYKDPYAQFPNTKIGFLESCLVIDVKDEYLELVKYKEGILPPREGIIPSILKKEKRYRFKDTKQVEYVGWIHQSKLLLNRKAWVAEENLKPLRYLLQIGNSEVLVNRDALYKKDTAIVYADPDLKSERVLETKFPLLKDVVYIYKKSDDGNNLLIGYTPSFNDEQKDNVFGWVDKKMLLDIGQQQVFIPKDSLLVRHYEAMYCNHSLAVERMNGLMTDSAYLVNRDWLDLKKTELLFLFNQNPQSEHETPEQQDIYSTLIPTEVWDHSPNKVVNILGQYVNYPQFQDMKKKSKKLNIVLIFEKKQSISEKLLYLTNSIQRIYTILEEDEFVDYEPSYSAICFNHYGVAREFSFSNSFVGWLDFVQRVANEPSSLISTPSKFHNGLEKALNRSVDLFKHRKGETNMAIVVGTSTNILTEQQIDRLAFNFANNTTRLFFWQLENEADDEHTDFILTAKELLYKSADFFSENKRHILVEHALDKRKNVLKLIDEKLNAYLFDYPENSMYQGGVAFPKISKSLHPVLFDEIIEILLLQIAEDNATVIASLQKYFDGIGLVRSKTHSNLIYALHKRGDWHGGIFNLPTSSYEDKFQVEYHGIGDSINEIVDHYFLLSAQEHEGTVNAIKRLAPDVTNDVKINRKFRKRLKRSYVKVAKELAVPYCYKEKPKNTPVSKLLFMSTGMAVKDSTYQEIPIKHLKCKKKMTHEELKLYLEELRAKAVTIEEYPISKKHEKYTIQDMEYLLIPAEKLP